MLSFDPSGLQSGNQCVDFLKEKNIGISQKLGARLLSLKNNNIELTLAALEDSSPGSDEEKFLLLPELLNTDFIQNSSRLAELISDRLKETPFKFIIEDGTVKIISFYEEPVKQAETKIVLRNNVSPASLMTQKSISPQSLLNDRKYIEELAFSFLDSQDESVIGESLRKLVRIAIMSNQAPVDLLINAINKGNPLVWLQVADIIKELLDKSFGEKLSKMFKTDIKADSDAIFAELLDANRIMFKTEILMAILPHMMKKDGNINLFLDNQDKIDKIIRQRPDFIDGVTRGMLALSETANPLDIKKFRTFLKNISTDINIASSIIDAVQQETSVPEKIHMLWFLSALENVEPEIISRACETACAMILKNPKTPVLLEALKTVYINFIPESLTYLSQLCEDIRYRSLHTESVALLIDIWEEAYQKNSLGKGQIKAINYMLKAEIEKSEETILKKLITMSFLKDEIIAGSLKKYIRNKDPLLHAALWVYTGDKSNKHRPEIPGLINRLIPDGYKIVLQNLEQMDDEVSDDELDFLASLVIHSLKNKKSVNGKDDVIRFLHVCGEKHRHEAKTINLIASIINASGEQIDYAGEMLEKLKKLPITDEEFMIKTLFQLFPLLSEPQREKEIESFTNEINRLSQSEIGFFLDELTNYFGGSGQLESADKLINVFLRENAFKLTTPSLSLKFSIDETKSEMIKKYDEKKWNWENVGQTLFCCLRIIANKTIKAQSVNRAADLITYVFRHWSEKNRPTVFILKDALFFRIAKEFAEIKNEAAKKAVIEITKLVCDKIMSLNIFLEDTKDLLEFLLVRSEDGDSGQKFMLSRSFSHLAKILINNEKTSTEELSLIDKIKKNISI